MLKLLHRWKRLLFGSPEYKYLYRNLSKHHNVVKKSFHHTHKHAKKLLNKHSIKLENLRHAGVKAAAGAALATSMFVAPAYSHDTKSVNLQKSLTAEVPSAPAEKIKAGPENPNKQLFTQEQFAAQIRDIMSPSHTREGKLSGDQLSQIQKMVKDQFDINVDSKTTAGFGLLDDYGFAGAEQHIPTHVGDSASQHVNKDEPLAIITGLTGGRGAWGYAPKAEEKWYVVAQTFRSPDFGTPATKGLAGQRYIVIQIPSERNGNHFFIGLGGIWDAGPGVSTGKVFGLSPEYWYHLGETAGSSRKDQIIMLPVTDSGIDASQLGPLGFK